MYVWTRGDEVLYVGLSFSGAVRPLTPNHERLRDFQPGDRLTVWRVAGDVGAVYAAEADLIRQLQPRLNAAR